MRSKKNVTTLSMDEGEYLETKFNGYVDMAVHAIDWTLLCTYELKPDSINGIYKILALPNMQIAYTHMGGAIMYDFISPEDTVSFSVVEYNSHKICLDEMKLHTADIAIIESTKQYNFMYNGEVKLLDVSIKKKAHASLFEKLLSTVNMHYHDVDGEMAQLLHSIITSYADKNNLSLTTLLEIEQRVCTAMLALVSTQVAKSTTLSKSEKIALNVKEQIIHHMDVKINIKALAQEHKISERSLQTAFKKLFGFTPVEFLRLMKLNLVHHELMKNDETKTTVSRIASKWGFNHMGRFSGFYTELFGENPSVTLKKPIPIVDGMSTHCVERKEEYTL